MKGFENTIYYKLDSRYLLIDFFTDFGNNMYLSGI